MATDGVTPPKFFASLGSTFVSPLQVLPTLFSRTLVSPTPLLGHTCGPFAKREQSSHPLPPSFPSGSILSSPSPPSLFPSLPPPNFSHFEVPLRMWLNFESGFDTFKKRHCLPFSPMCHVVMKIHVNWMPKLHITR